MVQFLQNLNFHRNVIKFVWSCTSTFDAKVVDMKTNVNDTQSYPKWVDSIIVPFKTIISQHQDLLPLIHMAKKYAMQSGRK